MLPYVRTRGSTHTRLVCFASPYMYICASARTRSLTLLHRFIVSWHIAAARSNRAHLARIRFAFKRLPRFCTPYPRAFSLSALLYPCQTCQINHGESMRRLVRVSDKSILHHTHIHTFRILADASAVLFDAAPQQCFSMAPLYIWLKPYKTHYRCRKRQRLPSQWCQPQTHTSRRFVTQTTHTHHPPGNQHTYLLDDHIAYILHIPFWRLCDGIDLNPIEATRKHLRQCEYMYIGCGMCRMFTRLWWRWEITQCVCTMWLHAREAMRLVWVYGEWDADCALRVVKCIKTLIDRIKLSLMRMWINNCESRFDFPSNWFFVVDNRLIYGTTLNPIDYFTNEMYIEHQFCMVFLKCKCIHHLQNPLSSINNH